MSERKRVYQVERTLTERYYYDPDVLAQQFGVTAENEVIDLFEQHDGSVYGETLFYGDASPQVGIKLIARWDDE